MSLTSYQKRELRAWGRALMITLVALVTAVLLVTVGLWTAGLV